MTKIEQIELELWRFRSIDDHDIALNRVQHYISKILQIAKSKEQSQ